MALDADPFADLPDDVADPFADIPKEPRRGGIRAEVKPYVAGEQPSTRREDGSAPLPAGVQPSSIEGGRGRINPPTIAQVKRNEQAATPRSWGEVGSDLVVSLAKGGNSVMQLPLALFAPGGDAYNWASENGKQLADMESPTLKAQRKQIAEKIAAEPEEARKFAVSLMESITNPGVWTGAVVEQLPIMGALLATGTAGGVLARSAVAPIGSRAIAAGAERIGANAAMAAGAAVAAGGDAAQSTFDRIMDPSRTPESLLKQNADYNVLLVRGMTPDDARKEIADSKSKLAAALAAPLGAISGVVGLKAPGALSISGSAPLVAGAKRGAAELGGELGEELGTQVAGNFAVRTVDPSQSLTEGFGETAAQTLIGAAGPSVLAGVQGARSTAAGEFGRAFEQDVANTGFSPEGVQQVAAGLMSPTSPLRDGQFVRPQDTAVRAEDMPTEVVTPEALAAEMARADAVKAAQAVAPDSGVKAEPVIHPITGETVTPDDPRYADMRQAKGLPEGSAQQAQTGVPGAAVSPPVPAAPPVAAKPSEPAVDAVPAPQGAAAPSGLSQGRTADSGVKEPGAALSQGGIPRVPSQLGRAKEALKQNARAAQPAADEDAKTRADLRAAIQTRVGKRADELERVGLASSATKLRSASAEFPVVNEPQPGPKLEEANALLSALSAVTGRRKGVAYQGSDSARQDGFFDPKVGAFAVDINRPELPVQFTIFHEFTHVIQEAAEKGDAQAKRAEVLMDRIWDMISDEGKRTYAGKYLFKAQLAEPGATLDGLLADPKMMRTLRKEMLADFMGKRALDRRFLKKLAQRDPENFGDFVRKWIELLKDLIEEIKHRGKTHEKDVDQHLVGRLEEAKAIAEEALVLWAAKNEPKSAPAESNAPVQSSARQAYEVAPDPNDKPATDNWNSRPVEERVKTTYSVDDKVFPLISKAVGVGQTTRVKTFGGYMGQTNPAVLRVGDGVSDGDMKSLARAVGYVYNQDSVLMLVDTPSDTSIESDLLRISLDRPLTYDLAKAVYDAIRADNGWVQGFTGRERDIDIINVGDKITPEMVDGVRKALEAAKIEGAFYADLLPAVNVEFIERGQYEDDAETEGLRDEGSADARLPGDRAALAQARQLAAKLLEDQEVQYSRREEDELGGFNPFQNEVEDYDETYSDESYVINDDEADRLVDAATADLRDISLELESEGYSVTGLPKVNRSTSKSAGAADFSGTSNEEIKAAGLMAESAYPDPAYRAVNDDSVADVVVAGRPAEIVIRSEYDKREKGSNPFMYPEGVASFGSGYKNGVARPNFGSRNRPMSAERAKQLAKIFTASADLFARKFDLKDSVRPAQAKRVLTSWKRIAKMSGAFEFMRLPESVDGKTYIERAQKVADAVLAGSRFQATAGRAEARYGSSSVELSIFDTKTGKTGEGTIEIRHQSRAQGGPVASMHTETFEAGSSFGKPFYQVAFGLMDAIGDIPVESDGFLLGVNTYRRTEQMLSAASRSGKARVVQPGIGQRIYGWEDKAKAGPANDRNLTRLFLAGARNAAEFVPDVQGLTYDLATDKFSWPDGSDAESFVTGVLKNPEVRMVSISRSTLARAAITFAALDGRLDLDGVEEAASPVLYSARVGGYDGSSTELGDGYSRLGDRKVNYQVRVAETGEIATLTVAARTAMQLLDDRAQVMRDLISCLKR